MMKKWLGFLLAALLLTGCGVGEEQTQTTPEEQESETEEDYIPPDEPRVQAFPDDWVEPEEPEEPTIVPAQPTHEQHVAIATTVAGMVAAYEDGSVEFGEQFEPPPEGIQYPQHILDEIDSGVSSFGTYEDIAQGVYRVEVPCYIDNDDYPRHQGFMHMSVIQDPQDPEAFLVEEVTFSIWRLMEMEPD